MAKVNRNSLRSNYQNKGDVYDDVKTEAVFEALADQIDTNDQELVDYKTKLASIMDGASGAHEIGSATISGVVGNNVFTQINDLKQQINQSTLGQIPNGSIGTVKLAADAKAAGNITVADNNNHFTSADVEGVLNELFTFANDGKTAIATVVGSPATTGDTFSQLQTQIQNSKNTLATNLSNKGQASTGSEALSALVDKVANVNTGKKFASGTTTVSAGAVSVSGLGFTPSVVIVEVNNTANAPGQYIRAIYYSGVTAGSGLNSYAVKIAADGVVDQAFTVSSGSFSVSSSAFGYPGRPAKWTAYE